MQSKANSVDEYLQEVPEERQEALSQLREFCIKNLIGYDESMEYGMPSYKKKSGEIEVAFASQKNYISLYILKEDVLLLLSANGNPTIGRVSSLNSGGMVHSRQSQVKGG